MSLDEQDDLARRPVRPLGNVAWRSYAPNLAQVAGREVVPELAAGVRRSNLCFFLRGRHGLVKLKASDLRVNLRRDGRKWIALDGTKGCAGCVRRHTCTRLKCGENGSVDFEPPEA